MKKLKPTYNGISFDSKEEIEFYMWCEEAKLHGFIDVFWYHDIVFDLSPAVSEKVTKTLKTKTKEVDKVIFREHTYKPDFALIPFGSFDELNHGLRHTQDCGTIPVYDCILVDVKPQFELEHSKNEVFRVNQKWVYDKHHAFINKVIPKEFFEKTWAPALFHKTTGRPLEKYSGFKSVRDIAPLMGS